jgi:hypothetical protein
MNGSPFTKRSRPGARIARMSEAEIETASSAGHSATHVNALVARLEEEIRLAGPRHTGAAGASAVRLNARAAADRLARVTADRSLAGRPGPIGTIQKPVKFVVRKLARWYVEPVFADQRAFNDALLRLIDDLYAELDRLRAELREARAGDQP